MKTLGTFADWLNIIDAREGYDWRLAMAELYSWRQAYDEGLTPLESIQDCLHWLGEDQDYVLVAVS